MKFRRLATLLLLILFPNVLRGEFAQEAAALRKQTAGAGGHSFSRDWFAWEFRLRRYIDEGRTDKRAIALLAAFFRGTILDHYRALEQKGEGGMLYLFHTSIPGNKVQRIAGDKTFKRDVHGGGSHGGWGGHARMIIYEELARQGILTEKEQLLVRKLVVQSLQKDFLDFDLLERGANNRPFKNTGGLAAAVRIFPKMPRAAEIRAWIDRQWRELSDHGDIFEVNHFPYGGLHLTGLLEIAQQTGRINRPADRKLVKAIAQRCLLFDHGMGVRGHPNCRALSNNRHSIDEMLSDPWHKTYYGDSLIPDFWYRVAQEFRNSEFLWAAVQTSIGPEPPVESPYHQRWKTAYFKRFSWFLKEGVTPRAPTGGSSVDLLSPTKHRITDRLYLSAKRDGKAPFASFYLYDRNNEYMHCFDDAMGRLYEYCVDGAKLLGSAGKYNGIFLGQSYYDMLMVRHPSDAFPIHPGQPDRAEPFLDQAPGIWRRASCSLPDITHSRTGPDSKNWIYRPDLHDHWTWRRRDDLVGGSAANMDGLVYLNNEYTLKSVTVRLNGNPDSEARPDLVFLRNLRLAGPKGDLTLASFEALSELITATRWKGDEEAGAEDVSTSALSVVDTNAGKALQVLVEPGYQYGVRVGGFEHRFNLAKEYTRVTFDFNAMSDSPSLRSRQGWRYGQTRPPALVSDMILNDRTVSPSHDVRGGILEPKSVRAEDRTGDSYGSFTYRNYFGARNTWRRDTVLTKEGYLIVRDEYRAGSDSDGYRVGPIWCLRTDSKVVIRDEQVEVVHENPNPHHGRHWFSAPAFDHASWATKPKRLLVFLHHRSDQSYGQLQHQSAMTQEIRVNSSWACAPVKSGTSKVFLSVLVPHDADQDPDSVRQSIGTGIDAESGKATATIGQIRVEVLPDHSWLVTR